jgi:hypothetical protein
MLVIDHSKYYIEEFRFSPVGLVPYTKVNIMSDIPPIEIFSSPEIQKRAISQFEESSLTKPIFKTIKAGIENKKIIIGYTNQSKFDFLYNKIKLSFGIKKNYALGFYFNLDNTIYIVLDDNVSLLGNTRYNLDRVLTHELCHMAAKNYKKTSYLKNVSSDYLTFYTNYIIRLIGKEFKYIPEKDIAEILNKKMRVVYDFVEKLHHTYDANTEGNFSIPINDLFHLWFYFFANLFYYDDKLLNSDQINDAANATVGVYMENFQGKKNYHKDTGLAEKALIHAYFALGLRNFTTTIGQEVVFPSEIIAIKNQYGIHQNIVNSINKIDMG